MAVSFSERVINKLFIFLQVLYLCRFQVLILTLFVAFMPFTVYFSLKNLLANLYDLSGFLESFWFSLFAFLLAFSIVATTKLVLLYGAERVDFDRKTTLYVKRKIVKPLVLRPYLFIIAGFAATFLVLGTFLIGENEVNFWRKVSGIVSGFIAAILLLFCADIFQRLMNRERDARLLERFLFPFPNPLGKWANKNTYFYKHYRNVLRPLRIEKLYRKLPMSVGRGILRYDKRGKVLVDKTERAVFHSGHIMSLSLFLFFLFVYVVVGWAWKYIPEVTDGFYFGITAISYVMLLLTVLLWFFSGLAFLFDRYRVPVLMIICLIYLLTAFLGADDYYTVLKLDKETYEQNKITPAQALTARPETQPDRPQDYIIVVAANGGGIQAGAWTARVLTGIEKECQKEFGRNFHGCGDAIRLISSVSGGSAGAMYFVNSYDENGVPKEEAKLDNIFQFSAKTSLGPVAWGLTYPDFARGIIPFYTFKDGRGQALEDTWIKNQKSLKEPLMSWREGVRKGWRPAVIFNATVTESGERLLISTTDICSTNDECRLRSLETQKTITAQTTSTVSAEKAAVDANARAEEARDVVVAGRGRRNFYEFIKNKDIPIATAVRLSASFPYVTPAPRAAADDCEPECELHIVDGGYYDNFGVSSVIEWLNEGLSYQIDKRVKNVLLIQIRGDQMSDAEFNKTYYGNGWLYQAYAPLQTLLNVRTTGQFSHNEAELGLFRRYWQAKGVNIQTAVFEYEYDPKKEQPPLSWHLTETQKKNLNNAWEKIAKNEDRQYHGWDEMKKFIRERINASATPVETPK
jgi:hypothetical protein